MKIDKKFRIVFVIALLCIAGVIAVILTTPKAKMDSCLNSKDGICLDLNSQFCGCNITSHTCPSREKGLCNLVQCINNRNLTLDYSSNCPHCQHELSDLYPFQDSFNKVDCSKQPCNVSGVPTWKDSVGRDEYIGYAPVDVLFQQLRCNK